MVQTHPPHLSTSNSTTPFELLDVLPDIPTILSMASLVFFLIGIIFTIVLYRSAFSSTVGNFKKHQGHSYHSLQSNNTSSIMNEPHGAYSSSVNTPLTPTFRSEEMSCNIQHRRQAISTSEASQNRVNTCESQAEANAILPPRQPLLYPSITSLSFKSSFATAKRYCGTLVQIGYCMDGLVDRLADWVVMLTRDQGDDQELLLVPSMEGVDDTLPV
jgi:hypothetical protein